MKSKQIITSIVSLLVFLTSVTPVFAEPITPINDLAQKIKRGTLFLFNLSETIEQSQDDFANVTRNMQDIRQELQMNDEKIESLKTQMSYLAIAMLQSNKKLLAVKKQIAENKNAIVTLQEKEKIQRAEQTILKDLLKKYVLFLYDQHTLNTNTAHEIETSKMLLASLAVNEIIQEQSRLEVMGTLIVQITERMDMLQTALQDTQAVKKHKQKQLTLLEQRLMAEQRNLEMHKRAKEKLLEKSYGTENVYYALLEQNKQEQQEIELQIKRLKENYSFIETKLAELKDTDSAENSFNIDQFTQDLEQLKTRLATKPLRWPVNPALGISAYFKDEAYEAALGVAHNAIDIPVSQGTAVKAAMSGIVYKVQPVEGLSYSYVIIAHREGLLTLYGHVSEISVAEGDTVNAGQVIGKSGGTPGTKGAGWLTTGAHLHFEVFKNWKHADPLEYLPLEYLPLQYVPEKYLNEVPTKINIKEKVKREKDFKDL